MTLIDPRASRSLALKARLSGGQAIGLSETFWDVSGRCERPARVTVEGRKYQGYNYSPEFGAYYARVGDINVVSDVGHGHATHMEVRCGRCAPCLAARRHQWVERARTECARATRTWFVTLTASATTQLRWSADAAARLRAGGTDPTTLNESEWYRELTKQAGRDLQLYLKRVRKKSGSGLRILFVFERHEGGGPHAGLPHIHGLVHETPLVTVKYRTLRSEWPHGYSTQKLLTDGDESETKVASYISKCLSYLTKSTDVRIRASRHYGVPLGQEITRADRIGLKTVTQSGDPPRETDTYQTAAGGAGASLRVETPEGRPALATANAYAIAKAGGRGV